MAFENHVIVSEMFNIIHTKERIIEVAAPNVFVQLVAEAQRSAEAQRGWRLMDQAKSDPMLYGLYGRMVRIGKGMVWVFCENPEMFAVPRGGGGAGADEELFEWWLTFGRSAILIAVPIYRVEAEEGQPSRVKGWTMRSTPMEYNAFDYDDHDPIQFYPFYLGGGYTVASGQTILMGLHRAGWKEWKDPAHLNALLRRWEEYTEYAPRTRWKMMMSIKTLPMLQFCSLNALVGDYFPMYATYGGCSPEVLDTVFQMTVCLKPLLLYTSESHSTEPPRRIFYTLPYYRGTGAAANWTVFRPYAHDMSLRTLQFPGTTRLHTPDVRGLGIPLCFWAGAGADAEAKAVLERDWIQYLGKESDSGPCHWTYRLIDATFQRRTVPRRTLEAYWSFLRDAYFDTGDAWRRWVARAMVFYAQPTRESIMPWRFLHWLFRTSDADATATYTLRLWDTLPVLYHGQLIKKNLYELLGDFPEGSPGRLYRDRVLRVRIQGRLRVFHQFRRDMNPEVSQCIERYVRKHRDLLWL